jgi:outer membrane immunogenic protein
MKKLFSATALALMTWSGAAMAADVDVAGPVYRVRAAIPYSWTGFYIGVHGGGDWFSKNWFVPLTATNNAAGCVGCPGSAGSHTASSWLAGGQVGFNYQIAWFVGGVEAQISATKLQGSNAIPFFPAISVNSKTDTLGTFAARIGIAMDRTMFYLKGGGAFAHDKFWTSTAAVPVLSEATDTRWGWMIGVGVEWAFLDNWSVKAEYNHLEFRRNRETLLPVGVGSTAFDYDIEQTVDLIKVGVNYKFGYGSVVARY